MTTTPTKNQFRRRGLVLSRTKRRALRRREQQSLRYWKFITHCFSSRYRRSSHSLFAFFKRMRTALGALAFAFWLPAAAHAETFTVTTASDLSADDGQLTLREAIISANESPGPDTIDFAEELSGEVLTLAQGELVISDDLAIDGSSLAEAPIIDADQKSRLINVTAPEGDLELTHLTLRNGKATEDGSAIAKGGGILFDSSGELKPHGFHHQRVHCLDGRSFSRSRRWNFHDLWNHHPYQFHSQRELRLGRPRQFWWRDLF
ncbi:CSLREA domain-containing protein [Verrucomicrobiaceae bacterium 227]